MEMSGFLETETDGSKEMNEGRKHLIAQLIILAFGVPTVLGAAAATAILPDWRGHGLSALIVVASMLVTVKTTSAWLERQETRRIPAER
jgi:hypothetical protein